MLLVEHSYCGATMCTQGVSLPAMNCPYCSSCRTSQLTEKTSLGYKMFRCSECRRKFNERSGTVYNHLQFPTDIVLLVVLWRLRYKLSLRDLAEMFLERGFAFTHKAVRDWDERFAPLITDQLRLSFIFFFFFFFHTDET